MKIRNGFVSNSSSSSFAIPESVLTDEQKEAIFCCLCDGRETKIQINDKLKDIYTEAELYPERGLPVNIEYHNIFQQMVDNDEWLDLGWGTSSRDGFVTGEASMWNGSLEVFLKKIGIDITSLEIVNHGHMLIRMPSNPEALKLFSERRKKQIEWYNSLTEEWEKEYVGPIIDNPYELDNSEFEDFYGDLQFESKDGYSYIKKLKSESK